MKVQEIYQSLQDAVEQSDAESHKIYALPWAMTGFYRDVSIQRQILSVYRNWETGVSSNEGRSARWAQICSSPLDFDPFLGLLLYGAKYASTAGGSLAASLLNRMWQLGEPIEGIEATDLLLEVLELETLEESLRDEVDYYVRSHTSRDVELRLLPRLGKHPLKSWLRLFAESGVRRASDAISMRLAMRRIGAQERFPFVLSADIRALLPRTVSSWEILEACVPETEWELEPLASPQPGEWAIVSR